MKTCTSMLAAAACAALLWPLPPARANATFGPGTRIRFARGSYGASVRGALKSGEPSPFYNLTVRAGQRMSVEVVSLTRGGIVFFVQVAPPHGVPSGDKSPRWSTRHTQAGRYVIRVAANLMASNGNSGRFRLRVRVR